MSRIILTTLGILFCSTSAFGQQFQVPQNTTPQTNRATFQPPSTTGFQPVQTTELQQPIAEPQVQSEPLRPVQTQEPKTEQPQIIIPQKQIQPNIEPQGQTHVELPAPKAEIIELKNDTQVYRSAPRNNAMGVSDYRFQVAKEKARARRMRLEVKKWYGVDSARPVVAPLGNLPTYSAYYNGVFSRHHLNYNYGNNFYFHVPVAR